MTDRAPRTPRSPVGVPQSPIPPFGGFPGVARATAIPNTFFALVLPRLQTAGAVLAFLWAERLIQERRGEARFVSAAEIWATAGARDSFERLGGGRGGLDAGLEEVTAIGALIKLTLAGSGAADSVYLVNDPASRKLVARARAGDVQLRPRTAVVGDSTTARPDIFRLYEDHIGTITPIVGEQLAAAADTYPPEWIEAAFREAAELNARSWRYIERILQTWAEEGRAHEATRRDGPEDRRQRYLGGAFGHLIKYE